MTKPVVLVTSTSLSDAGKKILHDAGAEVIYMAGAVTEDALFAQVCAANINAVLLRGSPPFTRRVLEAAKYLKIIAKHGAGVDSVDIDAATERGIVVVTAGDANADPVAEAAIMFMLALARDLPKLNQGLRAGKWDKANYQGREFRGRTVGIVGFGAIGRRTARLARALGANVVLYSRSAIKDPEGMEVEENFERLLGRVDILSLHCSLNDQTRGMLGDKQLRMMKPTALLINTARGQLIDEAALADALQSGRLAGAGLETFAQEPTDPKNPLIFLDNVICTPHVSALTADAMVRMGSTAAANIVGYVQRGECNTKNVVNPLVLKSKTH
jgi:D-3-phosphoglycerate dehydrogenase